MSRRRVRASELAKEVGWTSEDVVLFFRDEGISLRGPDYYIPRSKAAVARRLFGIQRPKSVSPSARKAAALANHRPQRTKAPSGFDSAGESLPLEHPVRRPRKKKVPKKVFRWQTVGRAEKYRPLTAREVEAIHWQIVEDFRRDRDPIEPPGVKEPNLLESALFRSETALGGVSKYPSVAMGGAAMFHALVLNHPFHNGNKRTGLVALIAFLDTHGYVIHVDESDLFEYVLRLARHEVLDNYDPKDPFSADKETLEVSRWLQGRMRRHRKGEFILQFRQLRPILAEYGCELEQPHRGNRMNIRRGLLQTQIAYTDDGMDVAPDCVHKIRRDLELDDAHDVDSYEFYRTRVKVPEFIAKYRGILRRLAEFDREGRTDTAVR